MGIRGSCAHLLWIKASWLDISSADPQKQRPEHPPQLTCSHHSKLGKSRNHRNQSSNRRRSTSGDNPLWESRRAGENPLQLISIISGF